MGKWLTLLTLFAVPLMATGAVAAEGDGVVTGVIAQLDRVDDVNTMIRLKVFNRSYLQPYLVDQDSKVLVPNLQEGITVTIVFYEATADLVVRTLSAAAAN